MLSIMLPNNGNVGKGLVCVSDFLLTGATVCARMILPTIFIKLGSIMGWDRIMDQDRDNGSGSILGWDRIRSVRNQYGSGSIIDSD